jgi:hypothetical protein
MAKNIIYIIVTSLLLTFSSAPAQAADFDHSDFHHALEIFVDDAGRVDYPGIAGSSRFKKYLTAIESVDIESMAENARLAFWINAYNAITIDKVIRRQPVKSVRETFIPGLWTSKKFFKTREHKVAGQHLSQDDIEHAILRKRFREPKIHFAVICASRGCPPHPRFAYTEENVQAALDEETRM